MRNLTDSKVVPLAKKWWVNLIWGLLFVLLGVWVVLTPLASYASLTFFFSLALVIVGTFEIFGAVFYKKGSRNWGWYFIGGIIDFSIGVYLLINPILTMTIIPYIFAAWLLFRGAMVVATSLQLSAYRISGWKWMFLTGVGTLLFASLIIFYPIIGGLGIVYTTAFAFLGLGLTNIISAYHMNRIQKQIRSLRKPI